MAGFRLPNGYIINRKKENKAMEESEFPGNSNEGCQRGFSGAFNFGNLVFGYACGFRKLALC